MLCIFRYNISFLILPEENQIYLAWMSACALVSLVFIAWKSLYWKMEYAVCISGWFWRNFIVQVLRTTRIKIILQYNNNQTVKYFNPIIFQHYENLKRFCYKHDITIPFIVISPGPEKKYCSTTDIYIYRVYSNEDDHAIF